MAAAMAGDQEALLAVACLFAWMSVLARAYVRVVNRWRGCARVFLRTLTAIACWRAVGRAGDKVALVDGVTKKELTFRALHDRVRQVAAGLHELGFRQGDVFAIIAPNIIEYAIIFHAVALVGGT